MSKPSIFSEFTNLYQLIKTLRFELIPVGETLPNMYKQLRYNEKLQTFLEDQEIEDAYQILKPHLDRLHEEFITDTLESELVKQINFASYLEEYRKGDRQLEKVEEQLRRKLGEAFDFSNRNWLENKIQPAKKEDSKTAQKKNKGDGNILTQNGLDAIKLIKQKSGEKTVTDACEKLSKFYGYLLGYNQNRANYYVTAKESATSVATRIVHENLPKFCDNLIQFQGYTKTTKGEIGEYSRRQEYLSVYEYLQANQKITQVKDPETDVFMKLEPIKEEIFDISYFTKCLSQKGIEEYNQKIGKYNLLINLYNQTKLAEQKNLPQSDRKFKKLKQFKTLFKQIGCGRKDPLFFKLTHDTIQLANQNQENYPKPYALEQILLNYSQAVQRFFNSTHTSGGEVTKVQSVLDLRDYILGKKDYSDLYWSKSTLARISDKYFANWYDLAKRLNTIDKKSFVEDKYSQEIKIPPVVPLSQLFVALDQLAGDEWRTDNGGLFRRSIFAKNDEHAKRKKDILERVDQPHQALLQFIFADVDILIEEIQNSNQEILSIDYAKFEKEADYREKTKEKIKLWLDKIKTVLQIIKYFSVSESKIKQGSLDPIVANALKDIISEAKLKDEQENAIEYPIEWFKWYDAVRNYLTKKPQEEATQNKLKLNFQNPTLLAGWDVNKESSNYCVILQDPEGKKYLAITHKDQNKIFEKEYRLGRGKKVEVKENDLYQITDKDHFWYKMEYNFFPEASKMIPKCSTQLKEVLHHFKTSEKDFIIKKGSKVSSGEKYEKDLVITKEIFELNNRVYSKEDLSISKMWYDNLDSGKKADYVKSFQKEYWNLSVKGEGNLSKDDLDKKWTDFCQKKYSDLSPNEKKYKDSLSKWIDFCKEFVTAYPKTRMFDYHFKPTDQYNSLDEFYRDFDASSYKLSLETKVNKARLDKLVNEGKIYLFEIRSQDSNHGKSKNHKDNLQTIYWQAVFSNLQNKPKLNGEAEIFYRKRVDNLKKKRDKKGKEIYENYRFRRNEWGKFLFHVPITLNLNLDNSDLETRLNQKFLQSGDTYYLGLDRGEKHLLYYCLINQKGEILKQGSLNLNFVDQDGQPKKIVTVKKKIGADDKMVDELIECANYNQLLEARAGNRDLARKQWQVIDDIKNLKLGYISQVVRKVVDLAVNLDNPRPTYIILEDLNTGFKRGRQKIEKQIYQKLELALAKKLNFLVDKRKTDGFGSVTQAIQLTPYVANYADIENKKQVGVMLYARANYTSQTDPLTGWRKTIYIQNGSEDYIKTQILDGKFTDIRWENSDYVFVYEDQNVGKTWCMYSGQNGRSLDRFVGKRGDKDQWQTIKVDIHHVLDTIFSNFDKTKSLLEQMKEGVELNPFENMQPWEALRWVINLIQQIRNCGEQGDQIDQDFLQSPVRDETGRHFDSRNYLAQVPNQDVNTESIDYLPLPICGDANGAFNIARKGLIMHEHIKRCIKNIQSGKQGKNDLNLFISEEEWDLWLNDRTCWESRLDVFSSQKALESYRKKK